MPLALAIVPSAPPFTLAFVRVEQSRPSYRLYSTLESFRERERLLKKPLSVTRGAL